MNTAQKWSLFRVIILRVLTEAHVIRSNCDLNMENVSFLRSHYVYMSVLYVRPES